MPTPTGPVTLGDLIREDKLLWVYCRECHHERDVNPANVPLAADTPVLDHLRRQCARETRRIRVGVTAGS